MTTFTAPTDEELRQEAEDFLKENPRSYNRLKASGALETVIRTKVEEARRYAEGLISTGYPVSQAWSMAVRERILERDGN